MHHMYQVLMAMLKPSPGPEISRPSQPHKSCCWAIQYLPELFLATNFCFTMPGSGAVDSYAE